MNVREFAREDGRMVRTYEYDDATVLVADLADVGPGATVEVVDGTAMVVRDDGSQTDVDLPTDDAQAFIRNGVLTIEMEATE